MADKIRKILAKLSVKEREIIKLLLLRIKLDDTFGMDIKHLQGHEDLFRVRKDQLRIIYTKNDSEFTIVRIDRRNDKTYKNL